MADAAGRYAADPERPRALSVLAQERAQSARAMSRGLTDVPAAVCARQRRRMSTSHTAARIDGDCARSRSSEIRRPRRRSQFWLLGVMVGFTTLALWLLAQAREG